MSLPDLPESTATSSGALSAPGARRALAGFFVSGLLFSTFGSILPSWGHHLRSDYETVGALFFCAAAGMTAAMWASGGLLQRRGAGNMLVTACLLAAGSLFYLANMGPPLPTWTRMVGFALVGAAGALLQAAIFQAISPIYLHNPAATVNLGGMLFSSGCLAATLFISTTFYAYTVSSVLAFLALIPAIFAVVYAKIRYPRIARELRQPIRDVLADVRSPTAILFAVLLFFQFGNEWSIAAWLPLFLVQRLGISPSRSLLLLAVYWLALLAGRILAQALLPHVRHTVLLVASMCLALLGCLILALTGIPSGATIGVVLAGSGFASIYPLVVEKIGNRFPHYHPGFFNSIFSLGLTGALLAPCALGFLAFWAGVRIVMLLPLFGSGMVLLVFAAISVESRWALHRIRIEPSPKVPS